MKASVYTSSGTLSNSAYDKEEAELSLCRKCFYSTFLCHMGNLMTNCCSCKHTFNHSQIYWKSSMNRLYFNSCNSRPHKPNHTQLAQKGHNTSLFQFPLFSHHIGVTASCSVKCLSLLACSHIIRILYLRERRTIHYCFNSCCFHTVSVLLLHAVQNMSLLACPHIFRILNLHERRTIHYCFYSCSFQTISVLSLHAARNVCLY